jgi:signal transduction histidine kinase
MREVSCRVFSIFFDPLERRGVSAYRMIDGTDVTLSRLRDKHERIDWSEMCVIMRNLGRVFSEDELIEIGRTHFRAPSMRFVFVVGRLLFTPMGFYKWANTPKSGAGNQMFSCVLPTHRNISSTECELDLELPDGFEVSWEFMLVAKGNMIEMPALLGYPPAKVMLSRIPRGGRFHIVVPERTSVLGRVQRAVTWPFTVQAAASELKEAHETLTARYDQLQDAKTALERKGALLDTAYRFGQRIWSERDPLATAGAIVTELVAGSMYAAATLEVAAADAPAAVERASAGSSEQGERLTVALSGHGRLVGELAVVVRGGADLAEARTLLELLTPTIALALDNAFGYRALADYQRGLEQRVEQRTAELRTARDSLAASVKALEEAHNARERIFANISHEIRTPLSLILLAVRDVEARAVLDVAARGGMRSIEVSARKLLRLVDELLLLAAGDAQSLRLRPEPIDVSDLLDTLATTWRPAIESNEVALEVDIARGCTALADPVAIERIVSNLLSNALKYTPCGGCITLSVARAGERIMISVRDTGAGIDDDLMSRLFGRFEQGQSPGQVRGGSGIGLSLVKELSVALGGNVTVDRLRPNGTEFRVTLLPSQSAPIPVRSPRLRPGDFGHGAAASIASGTVLGPVDKSAAKILLAEDDQSLAASIAQLLADDYTVIVALDGTDALELAARHRPHLLVTDIDMPGMNGVELTRRFRELAGDALAPVVMVSALADIKDRLTGLDAGAVDYVVKPFDPKELKARVHAQLQMRNLALRLHQAEKLAALGTLSAGLAHELRNPANGIVNAMGPLRDMLPPEVTSLESGSGQLLDVLAVCAEQISSLSKQLLGFRRGGALDLRPVPLGEVAHRALSMVWSSLEGIKVRDKIIATTPIRCAAPLFVQVLTNLIENAAHAAGPGGWIEIASHTSNGRVLVEVADSGPGVPFELRERIFEPFFTTKPPGVGTGLGLPLARDIVNRHGGTLEVRERGGRALFVIDLPSAGDHAAEAGAAEARAVDGP